MLIEKFPPQPVSPLSALGFDFGTQRIGVAFGQSLSGTAQAVSVLKAADGIPQWQELEQLIKQWQPDVFVVGLPYNMDGSDSDILRRATKFAQRLHGRFHKQCYGIDERLSSTAATEVQQSRRQEGAIDALAAQIILQDWFNELLSQSA